MTDLDYSKLFSDAQAELEKLQAAKSNLEERLEEVNTKIGAMTKTYNAIAPLVGRTPIPDLDAIPPVSFEPLKAGGISVAVKAILDRMPNDDFTAAKMRDSLQGQGWDWSKYVSPLATIQTTLTRLVAAGHAKDGYNKDLKKFFYSARRRSPVEEPIGSQYRSAGSGPIPAPRIQDHPRKITVRPKQSEERG